MSHRNAQLSGIIRNTIARMALQIPPDIAKVTSVIEVRLSKDLSYADIFLSAMEGVEGAMKFLQIKKGELRKQLSTELRVHKIPILRFHKDEVTVQGNRIDALLLKLGQEGDKK